MTETLFSNEPKIWGSNSTDAWAVGSSSDATSIILHWDGKAWSSKNEGLASIAPEGLRSVWGSSNNDVWAVGSYRDTSTSNASRPVIIHWDGGSWHSRQTGVTTEITGVLYSVWALSESEAWAVGYTQRDGNSPYNPVILHWDGTSWSRRLDGLASEANGFLQSIWGTSPSDVWAVGSSASAGFAPQILHWDGTSWTDMKGKIPSGTMGTLYTVWGFSKSDVWAVGAAAGSNLPLILHWDGTSWSPKGIGATSAIPGFLYGLWGFSPTNMWAVGFGKDSPYNPILFHWNGKTWTDNMTNLPAEMKSLYGVWGSDPDNLWVISRKGPFRRH